MINIDIHQIAETEEEHTEVEASMDRIIEENHVMSIIIEMTIEETILEIHNIKEVKFIEVDTEGIEKTTILEEVDAGLGIASIHIISEGITETVIVGLD